MHKWVFDRNSWLIRFYLWLWEADPKNVNFCKLWWGIVLSPLGLFIHAVVLVFVTIGSVLNHTLVPVLRFILSPLAPKIEAWEKKHKEKKRKEALLDRTADRADRGVDFFQRHPWIKFFWWGFWILCLVALVGFLLVALVLAFIHHFWAALIATGCVIGGFVLLVLVIALISHLDKKGTFKKFGQFLYHGYKAVKTRTCPVVEIREPENVHATNS